MNINDLIQERNITKYRLAKLSEVPYATLNDICSGKTNLAKCSAETVYRLAKALEVTVEELIEPYMEKRPAFELFKSNMCHRLQHLGDIDFLLEVIENKEIPQLMEKKWYPESLYLLAMTDYICRINGVPVCVEYQPYRSMRLQETIYPASIVSLATALDNDQIFARAVAESIPEFIRYNIVESEIRNVV